jgi:aminoglycoside 6'-N-acetyltransferase I
MNVRRATPADQAAWLALRCALWPDGAEDHDADIRRYFRGELHALPLVLLAENEGRVIGLAEVSIRPYAEGCTTNRVGYLEGWYVEPGFRGRGVGKGLVRAAEAWARREGCTEFASDTAPENEASRQAHLACGFEDAGLIRCFRKSL